MATQYTAGLTTGQVLTAATMNEIGAAWETWTPTVTPSSGVFYVLTVNLARYGRIGKLVYGQIEFTLTSVGTATGIPIFTLPITATSAPFLAMGQYRETNNTGNSGIIDQFSTTSASMRQYNNANHIAANGRYEGSFIYEAA
jgi:hypothetical protein